MISILLSAYNGEKYIIEQLISLYKQTLKPDEVIIIDDCSSDSTYEKCRQFIADRNLSNWLVKRNDTNKGWKYNFHFGVQLTHGDIIFYCDQDDIWLENKIEVSAQLLKENPQLNVIATYEKDFYEDGHEIYPYDCDGELEIINIKEGDKNLNIRSAGCTMAVRKSFLAKIFSYYVDSWAHDDMVWKLASIDGSCALYHVATINHRLHKNNASRQSRKTLARRRKDNRDTIANYQQVIKYINTFFPDKKETSALYERYIYAMKKRDAFFEAPNISSLNGIIKEYRLLYKSPKQFAADIYVTIKGKNT